MAKGRHFPIAAWLIAAAASAYACHLSLVHATPIDRALPFIAVVLILIASVSHIALQAAVPLLVGGELAIPDERLRLLWFGVVIGASFGAAFIVDGWSRWRAVVLTIAGVLLLRWIPLPHEWWGREIIVIAFALAIMAVCRWTPLAVALAITTALFTPAIPLRTLIVPLIVLLAGATVRFFGFGFVSARHVAATVTAATMLFFAWSGALARALPLAVSGLPRPTPRADIRLALAPGETVTLDVPHGASHVILSGANVPRLRAGTVLGRIEPGRELRAGDLADWGALRREHYYNSRNRLPRTPAGLLRDYGYAAWVDGAARVPIRGSQVRITADRSLPRDARLQVESFEVAGQ